VSARATCEAAMADRAVDVFVTLGDREAGVGRLWSRRRRNAESQTVTYDDAYLAADGSYALDPLLPLVAGPLQTSVGREIFGAFSDSAPDRWGRRLIGRAERRRVQRAGGAPRSFSEFDHLLGVRDDLRQGALRFRDVDGEVFLAPPDSGVPSLLQLPELLGAAERLDRDEESEQELASLLRGGSSLGGARPKAHVLDDTGRIAIAKFPSPSSDQWDVMRWEAVALELARAAGMRVPASRLLNLDGRSVVVIDRFDRSGGRRIGYVSAMTMLERADGEHGSYLEIAEVLQSSGASATDDLRELWRRITFSILISNFDDHLRNHGFLRLSSGGWTLSPAFDVNPDPRPGDRHLSTAIDFDNTDASLELALDVAEEFRLDRSQALETLREVHGAVAGWRQEASRSGLKASEIELMTPAFVHDAELQARDLLASI